MKRMTFLERNAPEILGLVVIALLLLFGFDYAHGQTISPIVTECGKKCSGTFTVTNNGVVPLAVVVEPYSFSLDPATGKSRLRPLDATTEVQLDEMSARLGPHEVHEFGYKISCPADCAVTFFASMIAGRVGNGMALRLNLPTVVYYCREGAKNCRARTRQAAGLVN